MTLIEQRGELPRAYEPGEVEDRIYQLWIEGGYFAPRIDPHKKPFVIIMPPPNVTGELHLGHALTATLEDIMTRWHRMRGEPALWLPGVDHAGIATQVVVEHRLAEEGLTKQEIGQEEFSRRAWQWASRCRATIMEQHRKLGASCDWGRERFTLDEGPTRAVLTTFVNLHNKGLVYRGERIINWCPRCQTAISDLEVEHKELKGHLYYIKYPFAEGSGSVTLATTRPETMFGDVAVAVNPDDPRFRDVIGKMVLIPVINRPIPVIADAAVDITFGTGALKITPSHDPVDFEVAQRHNLPLINILNPDGTLNEEAGPYAGFDRFEGRQALLSRLREEGLLAREPEPYFHSVGHCLRCGTVIEPWVSKQWFIKMAPLAAPAIRVVQEGRISIIPEQFTKVYLHWMENIRDWCVSRQLWWGHRIPAWYCKDCGEMAVSIEKPERCTQCGSSDVYQETDVLDTWFSSALWPHSTFGWPDDTEDLRYFYPTTVMETGYDILFFWVARMIMMGLENTGDIPFETVYLHGLIRDESGEKMSKLKGNVINPSEAIQKYGADALRFAITTGSAPGNDVRVSSQKLEAARNFANKLWNAARFVIRTLESAPEALTPLQDLHALEDRWIWSRFNRVVANTNKLLADFQFGEAERQIHDFLWGEFCDWYIELAKIRLRQEGSPSPIPLLVRVLETSLRLLHPFMPFITEEIWQSLVSRLPHDEQSPPSLIVAPYPVAEEALDPEAERQMESVIEIVRSIRNARTEFKVKPSTWIEAHVYADNSSTVELQSQAIAALARTQPLAISERGERKESGDNALVLVLRDADVVLPMGGMVDLDAERRRLQKEIDACQGRIDHLEARLADAAFLSKSPSFVVEKERGKLSETLLRLERLRQRLDQLEKD